MMDREHPRPGFGIIVSTQTCEMSFDIDADILITEGCPPASFIQRQGRTNRSTITNGRLSEVFVFYGDKYLPYDIKDLHIHDFYGKLYAEPMSQNDMEKLVASLVTKENTYLVDPPLWRNSILLLKNEDPFRDMIPFNTTVLLEEPKDHRKWQGETCPVPNHIAHAENATTDSIIRNVPLLIKNDSLWTYSSKYGFSS